MFFLTTYFAILLKCIAFFGFMSSPTHASFDWYYVYQMVKSRFHLYAAFSLFFLSFSYLCKHRAHAWFLIGLNGLVSLLLLIDVWYVRAFHTLPTLHLVKQPGNLVHLFGHLFLYIHPIDLFFIIDVLIFVWMIRRFSMLFRRQRVSRALFILTACASLPVLLYIPIGASFFDRKDDRALFRLYDATITCYNLSPIGYHVLDVFSFIQDGFPVRLTEQQRLSIHRWFEQKQEKLPDNRFKGLLKGKNLIMIQVESLENFVIRRSIAGQEITPTLNRMLESGIYFSNFYEQINEGVTSDAEFISNVSIYPLRKGVTFFSYSDNDYSSLPTLLKQEGYTSMALHADKGSYWNWAHALRSIGFERTADQQSFTIDESIGMGLSDGSFFRQALPILSGLKKPFYAFFVTMSSHAPYNLPQKQRDLRLEPSMAYTPSGGYLQSIHYFDRQIGHLLEGLRKTGLLDNTVIAIYGDHEGVHKYFANDVKAYPDWKNGKKVPFIIYAKGLSPKEVTTIGGQIDILPTLAYLMGVDEKKYAQSAMGRNLLNTTRSFAVLSDGRYVCGQASAAERALHQQGLHIADDIIKSGYFRKEQR